jgi:hypothetical protein
LLRDAQPSNPFRPAGLGRVYFPYPAFPCRAFTYRTSGCAIAESVVLFRRDNLMEFFDTAAPKLQKTIITTTRNRKQFPCRAEIESYFRFSGGPACRSTWLGCITPPSKGFPGLRPPRFRYRFYPVHTQGRAGGRGNPFPQDS